MRRPCQAPYPAAATTGQEKAGAIGSSGRNVSKKRLWAGRTTGALPVLMLLFSSIVKPPKPTFVVDEFAGLGYPESLVLGIGIIELACTARYAIPCSSVLGALLLTWYLGGATATHVRIGDSFYPPVVDETPVWLGLFLHDERLRSPLRLRR